MPQTSKEQLELLYEVSRSLHGLIDLDELLAAAIEKTKALLDADGCSVILLDDSGTQLYFPYVNPESPDVAVRLQSLRMPADRGIVGAVIQSGQPLVVTDVRADSRFYQEADQITGGDTRSIVCVPLRTRRGIIGVIECINKRNGSFGEADQTFLEALAGSIAIAIENARLYQAAKQSEARLLDEVALLERERPIRQRFAGIVGSGAAMEHVFRLIESAIGSPITVLLQGETGSGKEVVARVIHYEGPRKHKPFVAVNCGAFTETLLESELFGHRKGAFTGAVADKRGLFEAADGGSVFLDEVGDTPPSMQVKLLRVLERGEFIRVGDTDVRTADVRIISASNKDLVSEVRDGRFREDLYYRLNAFPIRVPPLRERREDIPMLAAYLLERLCTKWKRKTVSLAPETLECLSRYHWPGNVRELEHELERAVTLAGDTEVIRPGCLSPHVVTTSGGVQPTGTLRAARAAFERGFIDRILQANRGNVSHTAKALGISRVMLQRKMKALGLRAPAPVAGR
jgi:Nif-specific regulatory protein